jgi:hypothetical protein
MMKKIFALVLFLVLGKIGYSQYPLQQNLGSDSTVVISKGALQSRLLPIVVADTNAANAQRMRQYPGAQLYTTNGNFYLRNSNATKWILVSGNGGVVADNIYNSNGTLTGNRTLTGANYRLNFNGVKEFGVDAADSVIITSPLTYITSPLTGVVINTTASGVGANASLRLKTDVDGEWLIHTGNDGTTSGDLNFYSQSNVSPYAKFKSTGGIQFPALPSASTDTTTYKPLGISSTGNLQPMTNWPGGGAGTVTSVATNDGTGIKGGTITTSGTLYIDTTLISTRAYANNGLAGKLNISDTASMLAPYLRKADTTAMLSPYFRTAGVGLVGSGHTVSADTLLLSTRAWRQKGVDSVAALVTNGYVPNSRTITINGNTQDLSANRTWSVGTVTSVATNYGLTGGTITSSGTLSVDSASLSNYYLRRKDSLTSTNPLGYVTKKVLADTASAIRGALTGGTVTSVATNNGTGITGGTITSTGTLAIDTSLISTRAWRQKGVDSVAALIGAGYIPYTGATQNVDLGNYGITTGYVGLDLTPTGTPTTQGTIYWDGSEETAALIMNGTIQRVGLDQFYNVKNSSGATIPKGTAVRFAGTDGASGHILILPFLANGTYPSAYFMGVTSEDIVNGGFGKVSSFGSVEKLNTNAYNAGDLLYVSTTVAGGFQTTIPQAPNNIVLTAAVLTKSATNGKIIVRPTIGSNINNDEGVKITSPTNGEVLVYNSTSGLWVDSTIAAAGIAVTSVATNTSTGITGGTITTTGTLAIDTSLISTRLWRQKGIDSVQANLTAGLALKLNISDTASMLSPYKTYYPRNAISLTTTGSSGASTYNSSTGVLNVPVYTDQYVGTVTSVATNNGTGITGGTITTTGTLAIDTTVISTRAWRQKGIDSVASLVTSGYVPTSRTLTINGTSYDLSANRSWSVGTVTSVATNTSTGITGGTITGSGTIAADTLLLSTRAWRQKGVDSVSAIFGSYLPLTLTSTQRIVNINGQTFEVYGTTGALYNSGRLIVDPNYGAIGYQTSGIFSGLQISRVTNEATFSQSGATKILNSGSLEIGYSATQGLYKFDVLGTGRFTGILTLGSTLSNGTYQYTLPSATGTLALTSDIPSLSGYVQGSGTTNYIPKFTGSNTIGNSNLQTDASGNLGLGVTPSAWSTIIPLEVGGTGGNYVGGYSKQLYLGANHYYDGSNYVYKTTGYASQIQLINGGAVFNTAPSGTAGNAISFTQAMTLFSTGNLAVGNTTDAGYKLDVNGTGRFSGNLSSNATIIASTGLRVRKNTTSDGATDLGIFYSNSGDIFYLYDWNTATKGLALNTGTGAATFSSSVTLNARASNLALRMQYPDDPNYRLDINQVVTSGLVKHSFDVVNAGTSYANNLVLDRGNVGIGTSSPSYKLDVNGNVHAGTYFFSEATGNVGYALNSSGANVGQINNVNSTTWSLGYGGLSSIGTNVLSWNTSGNVGIGTTSPWTTLSIGTTAGIGTANDALGDIVGKVGLQFQNSIGGYSAAGIYNLTSGSFGGNLLFATKADGGNEIKERMRITSGGNVGIGTTSPAVISGYTIVGINNATYGGILDIMSNGATIGRFWTSGNAANLWSVPSVPLTFGTTDTERMRITSGGNVLVGTTTDDGTGKVQVSGNVSLNNEGIFLGRNSVTVSALNTDYVLINSVPNGIIVIRDNTSGGTGCYLLDPNAGVITIATNVNGTLVFTYSGGKWYIKKTSGTVATNYTWAFVSG